MKFVLTFLLFLITAQADRNVSYTFHFNIEKAPRTDRVEFTAVVPQSMDKRQTVEVDFSLKPSRIYIDKGVKYAHWSLTNVKSGVHFTMKVKGQLKTYELDSLKKGSFKLPAAEKTKYLNPEKYLESASPDIVDLARKIKDGKTTVETAENILQEVCKIMKYEGWIEKDNGALKSLKLKTGDCTDYSDLFIALCRAKKIPARFMSGVVSFWRAGDTPKHNRAEFYVESLGWVPVDPLWTDLKNASLKKVGDNYLIFSTRRNDPNLGGYAFWYYRYWGKPVKVAASIEIHSDSKQKKLPAKTGY